jgi:uncharacterized protein (TIGR04255 family)
MPINPDTTPEFEQPPVIETALGVEFKPIERWDIPHFGLFWERIRGDFPQYGVQPPLGSQIEMFDKPPVLPRIDFQLLERPEVRCWFFHSDADRLIQVQRDRFLHNWRKAGDSEYSRYGKIKPKFQSAWESFCDFLASESLGAPDVVQCEVTYINHIEIGQGWNSMVDLPQVVSAWSGETSDGFLPIPEGVQVVATYLIQDNKGRLHVTLQPAIRIADQRQVLQLSLTARGAPAGSGTAAILEWLDLGHEWVVRGFADFTSEKMHKLWGRRR